jgi:hypothetical protein
MKILRAGDDETKEGQELVALTMKIVPGLLS